MTAQIPEKLRYQGKDMPMCTEPLNAYFINSGVEPPFGVDCTALWRGYVGHWEISNNRLQLIGLQGKLKNGKSATLTSIFPDCHNAVFAEWYSGTIRLPQGKQIKYVHMGFGSTFERDLFLDIKSGLVVNTHIQQNGISISKGGPERYEAGPMMIFPWSRK